VADSNGQNSSGSQTTIVKTDPRQPYATVSLKKINGRWECEWTYQPGATAPVSERDLRIIERTLVVNYRNHVRGFRHKALLHQQAQAKIADPAKRTQLIVTGEEVRELGTRKD
jgi:hypothetical protein